MGEFDETLSNCIDQTLTGVLGRTVRDAIYLDLQTRLSIKEEDLPKHMESLLAILEQNFGTIATQTLSRVIARRLYSELGLEFREETNFTLTDYVNGARQGKQKL